MPSKAAIDTIEDTPVDDNDDGFLSTDEGEEEDDEQDDGVEDVRLPFLCCANAKPVQHLTGT